MLYDDLIVIGLNEFKKSDLIFRFSKYRKNWINWVLPFNRSDVLDKKFWNTNLAVDVKTFLAFRE
jgi:hypothetical protein